MHDSNKRQKEFERNGVSFRGLRLSAMKKKKRRRRPYTPLPNTHSKTCGFALAVAAFTTYSRLSLTIKSHFTNTCWNSTEMSSLQSSHLRSALRFRSWTTRYQEMATSVAATVIQSYTVTPATRILLYRCQTAAPSKYTDRFLTYR